MSNDFIAPLLPILSFGSVGESELPFPNYSIPISNEPNQDSTIINLKHVAQAVLKAKRVAVVCGAGISCASGIPDFRSTEGLFESLKKQYPEAKLTSGKDLFDASLFSSEANAAIFYTMISELKTMSDNAQPTAFHRFLKSLDDEGKLHRVYTQNIDGLEERAGLSYGLGSKAAPTPPRRRAVSTSPVKPQSRSSTLRRGSPDPLFPQSQPQQTSSVPSTPPRSRSSTPLNIIPKCIPLHGHLSTLSCPHCSHSESIVPHLPLLASGSTLSCPACTSLELVRSAIGGRSRGVGMMKPDVVLYGETHREGERVGEITRKDLMGVRPDLLIVVGTSLKVPGTKLLVRELAKVIRPAWTWTQTSSSKSGSEDGEGEEEEEEEEEELPVASGSTSMSVDSTTSTIKGGKGKAKATSRQAKPDKVSVIYLNYEFPKPSSEWKDVFDVWMRGDVQEFVTLVEEERKEEELRKEKKILEKEQLIQRREEKEKKRLEKVANLEAGITTPTSSQGSFTSTFKSKKSPTKPKEPKLPKISTVKPKVFGPKPKPIPKIKSTTGAGGIRKVPVKKEPKVVMSKKVEDVKKRTKHEHQFSLSFITSKPSVATVQSKGKN